MVTTFGSYATAPNTSPFCLMLAPSEQRQSAHGLAEKVVEDVGSRRHNARGARIPKQTLHPDLFAVGRSAADPHRDIERFIRCFGRRGLALQYAQHRVGTVASNRRNRVA